MVLSEMKKTSQFSKNFIKNCRKIVMQDIFLKFNFNTLTNCMTFTMNYHFFKKKIKIRKIEKLEANLHDKKRICDTCKKFNINIKSRISIDKNANSH